MPLNDDRFTGDDTHLLPTAADEEAAAEAEQRGNQVCEWFARCTRIATETRPHPVLGPVPICTPCQDRMNRL